MGWLWIGGLLNLHQEFSKKCIACLYQSGIGLQCNKLKLAVDDLLKKTASKAAGS